jgi:hypothetical protein
MHRQKLYGGDLLHKVALVFLTMFFLLTACQTKDPNAITLDEVLPSFEEQQLSLKERKVSGKNIFGMKLNGVRPSSYDLDWKKLLVYIYDSSNEREKGLEDFREKTATANMVSYKVYEVNNVLLFYVYEEEYLNSEIDAKIQNIVSELYEE